ncbi:MAG: hypothetical protein HFJ17_04210 [Clostridia bacterium]|nr:hypothetical protein [Clostridia bacterium]
MKKKYFYLICLILLIFILFIFISRNTIRNSKIGNNMNSQEIVDYILGINSYKATVTIQVNSNKNTNRYILKQEYNTENGCVQEVLEPSNIAGVKVTRKDENIIIENTNLSLTNIFTNYKGLDNSSLDLSTFIQEYKSTNTSNFEEDNANIMMKTSTQNKYTKSKILYINKSNALPVKMVINDNNQNTTIIIEYNDIELN